MQTLLGLYFSINFIYGIIKFEFLIDCVEKIKRLPKEQRSFYEKEKSLLYMLDGYDGIKITNKGYYCIYNRGVLNIYE